MKVHYSSDKQTWTTPIKLFNKLKHKYNLKIDVASSEENKLLDKYFTEEDSGLENDWLENSFCNPPYNNLRKWIEKAHSETQKMILQLSC